jgi:hypothetical protein
MELYTLSECYTPNERNAEGFISNVFLYKSKEEALAKMKEQMDYKADSIDFCEENIVIHGGDPTNPSGVTIARAKATDYNNDIYTWKINEYEVHLHPAGESTRNER